ncbi:MAG: DUF3656 domain-containing protein [Pyramidobacter sp.]|nr:DUF3656 domain-containing protein [Pyramidobacter sp.]
MKNARQLELLAPAGSWKALEAAVYSGADAVYLGGTNFGARAFADNFDRDELTRAVEFAHLYQVKIYVTVNTLVDDSEMKELAGYLVFLSNAGVDGIIVQDLGIVRAARAIVPELPLHASTQMTITNSSGVRFAAENGLCRAVPARELSIAELKCAAEQGIEIEAFVHGALCVCYSGQCLMSSMIGGRSGNRGSCAQPCRMPYSLVDAAGTNVLQGRGVGRYLLSPRDLNAVDLLPRLIEAGVCSFKIEGRMKRPEYVATVVGVYRRAIDSWRAGKFKVSDEDRRDLEQIFSRGFTTGYLERHEGKLMMSDARPDNRGVRIGSVVGTDRSAGGCLIRLESDLRPGDGLEFSSKKNVSAGTTVAEIRVNNHSVSQAKPGEIASVRTPRGVQTGMDVFKTSDADLMARAQRCFGEKNKRRIPVDVTVTARMGRKLEVILRDLDGRVGRGETSTLAEAALSRPLDEAALRRQIDRLGTTAYEIRGLTCDLEANIIVPASEINEARRAACRELDAARRAAFPSSRRKPVAENAVSAVLESAIVPKAAYHQPRSAKPMLTVWVDAVEKAEAALRGGADLLIFGGDRYSTKDLSWKDYALAADMAHQSGKKCAFSTPRIVNEGALGSFAKEFARLPELGADDLCIHNLGLWQLAREHEVSVPLWADMSLNIFNSQSLLFWKEHGAAGATLSIELNMGQIDRLAGKNVLPLECLVHGPVEMMVSEYCAAGSWLGGLDKGRCSYRCREDLFLTDRTGARFPLKGDQYCRMHVLNSQELCLADSVEHLAHIGISRLRIDGRAMTGQQILSVTRAYRGALDGRGSAALHGGKYTRGHYGRGVMTGGSSSGKK